jgi:hypothetical protein
LLAPGLAANAGHWRSKRKKTALTSVDAGKLRVRVSDMESFAGFSRLYQEFVDHWPKLPRRKSHDTKAKTQRL